MTVPKLTLRLCTHVIVSDAGLAPNPFHGYCTTALCTPSHMNARLAEGDWLVGHSPKHDGNRLVYAMRISEVLSMNQYFHDGRFTRKQPKPSGTPKEQCGDNLYFQDTTGRWKRLPSRFHNTCESFITDIGKNLRGHPVFVSDYFYYFGRERVAIPDKLRRVIQDRHGIRYTKGPQAEAFVTWLETKQKHIQSMPGQPQDLTDLAAETGPMLTDWIGDCTRQAKHQGHLSGPLGCQPGPGKRKHRRGHC